MEEVTAIVLHFLMILAATHQKVSDFWRLPLPVYALVYIFPLKTVFVLLEVQMKLKETLEVGRRSN